MRPLVIAVVIVMSVVANAQTPLPAPYCPAGKSPPSCGFLPSDTHVRRAEVTSSKLRSLLFASYMKCVSRAVIQGSQARQIDFDTCITDATTGAINRFNTLQSEPSCENFVLIALNLSTLSKTMGSKLYCNGTLPLDFGIAVRLPADPAVARVERGASKLLVKEYQKIVRCYDNGVEALATGKPPTIVRCVAKLGAVQARRVLRLDFGLPGFGSLGCFDEATGTDIGHLLTQIDTAANLNSQIFCSM